MLSCFSRVWLFATPWTVAHQAPLSIGFSRQEYQSGLPCPTPGDLPNPGTEPTSLMSPALAGGFLTTSTIWEAPFIYIPLLIKVTVFCWCLVAKFCLTFCDPMDCGPPASSVHRISQSRILEWITISFSRGPSQPRDQTHVSCTGRWILYWWATGMSITTCRQTLGGF